MDLLKKTQHMKHRKYNIINNIIKTQQANIKGKNLNTLIKIGSININGLNNKLNLIHNMILTIT